MVAKRSRMSSKRLSVGIQWYTSPRGNGHLGGKLLRWAGNWWRGMSTEVLTKFDMNGDCEIHVSSGYLMPLALDHTSVASCFSDAVFPIFPMLPTASL